MRIDDRLPDDAMRVYDRPTPSRDGKRIGVGVQELHSTITRVDGL